MSVSQSTLFTCGSTSVPNRALYSPKETEAILNISHATCYRLISADKLDARKLGGKTLITRESIERLIAELPRVGRQK
jgi:excisionase family DNA binding protein